MTRERVGAGGCVVGVSDVGAYKEFVEVYHYSIVSCGVGGFRCGNEDFVTVLGISYLGRRAELDDYSQ